MEPMAGLSAAMGTTMVPAWERAMMYATVAIGPPTSAESIRMMPGFVLMVRPKSPSLPCFAVMARAQMALQESLIALATVGMMKTARKAVGLSALVQLVQSCEF